MGKTKALISFAVTAKLICVFVFAYAKIRFSHDEAHIRNCNVNIDVFVYGEEKNDVAMVTVKRKGLVKVIVVVTVLHSY